MKQVKSDDPPFDRVVREFVKVSDVMEDLKDHVSYTVCGTNTIYRTSLY